MSLIWPHFKKESPCPACNHSDWTIAEIGDKKFICMRIASDHPAKDGGWYHEYGGKKPIYVPPKRNIPKVNLDFEQVMIEWWLDSSEYPIDLGLGVTEESLMSLGFVWAWQHKAWACPMRDGDNKITLEFICDAMMELKRL